MNPLGVVTHPRRTFAAAAERASLQAALLLVLATGVVSLALAATANALVSGSMSGLLVACLLPLLFLAYWLLEGWLVDAGAGILGASGRRRLFLSVSGYAFVAWVAYALLSLLEALALRGGGGAVASGLAWLTLPLLGWFVGLTVLAIITVYRVPPLNALALALLPYAVLMAATLVLGLVLGGLHGAGVV